MKYWTFWFFTFVRSDTSSSGFLLLAIVCANVTNYYFSLWEFSTSQKELLLVSNGSISSLISGGDSGESWVLVHALGLL